VKGPQKTPDETRVEHSAGIPYADTPVVPLEEFEEDSRDPEWQAFLGQAREYRAEMRRRGRLH
jgi:hypothetical protein